jgi:hypothetical protein
MGHPDQGASVIPSFPAVWVGDSASRQAALSRKLFNYASWVGIGSIASCDIPLEPGTYQKLFVAGGGPQSNMIG